MSSAPKASDEPTQVSNTTEPDYQKLYMPERLQAWGTRVAIVYVTTAIVSVLYYGVGYTPPASAVVLGVGALMFLFIAGGIVDQAEKLSPLLQEASQFEGEVSFRDFERARRRALSAFTILEFILSSALILALYSCLELYSGHWVAGVAAVGYLGGVFALGHGTSAVIKYAERIGLPKSKGFVQMAFIILLPAIILNALSAGYLTLGMAAETIARMVATLVIFIGVMALIFVPSEALRQVFPSIAKIAPARRNLAHHRRGVRNTVGILEWLIFADLHGFAFASAAIATIVFWALAIEPSHIVLVEINLIFAGGSLLMVLPHVRQQPKDVMRYVQRLGLQYAAIAVVVANLLLIYGYAVGWLGLTVYAFLFSAHGFPIPDQIYAFRIAAPWTLPFQLMLESAVVAIICILAASWLIVVIQSKSWKELLYVSIASAFVVALPYLPIDFDGWLASALPIVEATPSYVLALVIPAVKDLVTSEVQDLIAGDVSTPHLCPNVKCNEPIERSADRFCRFCGTSLVGAPPETGNGSA